MDAPHFLTQAELYRVIQRELPEDVYPDAGDPTAFFSTSYSAAEAQVLALAYEQMQQAYDNYWPQTADEDGIAQHEIARFGYLSDDLELAERRARVLARIRALPSLSTPDLTALVASMLPDYAEVEIIKWGGRQIAGVWYLGESELGYNTHLGGYGDLRFPLGTDLCLVSADERWDEIGLTETEWQNLQASAYLYEVRIYNYQPTDAEYAVIDRELTAAEESHSRHEILTVAEIFGEGTPRVLSSNPDAYIPNGGVNSYGISMIVSDLVAETSVMSQSIDGGVTWTDQAMESSSRSDGGGLGVQAEAYDHVVMTLKEGIYTVEPSGEVVLRQVLGSAGTPPAFFANGVYLVGTSDGTIYRSTDRETWVAATDDTGGHDVRCFAWGGGKYVVVCDDGVILSSTDGDTWTDVSPDTSESFVCVDWHDGVFIAVGNNGTICTSDDGDDWTESDSGLSANIVSLAGNGQNWVAGSDEGHIIYSEDGGETWNVPTLPQDINHPVGKPMGNQGAIWKVMFDGVTQHFLCTAETAVELGLSRTGQYWLAVPSNNPGGGETYHYNVQRFGRVLAIFGNKLATFHTR